MITLACSVLLGSLAFAAAPSPDKLSDPQIMGALTAANDGEIDAARLAQRQASDPQVKGFAQHMLADHTANNDQLGALARRLIAAPAMSGASADLTANAKSEAAELQPLSPGAAFDKAYIDRQVEDHQTVLDLLDKVLLPSATAEELRGLLKATRAKVAEHLESARKIKQELSGKR